MRVRGGKGLGDVVPRARQSWVQNVVARDQGEAFGVQGSGNLIAHQAPTQAAQAPGKVTAAGASTDTDMDTATDPSASPDPGAPS